MIYMCHVSIILETFASCFLFLVLVSRRLRIEKIFTLLHYSPLCTLLISSFELWPTGHFKDIFDISKMFRKHLPFLQHGIIFPTRIRDANSNTKIPNGIHEYIQYHHARLCAKLNAYLVDFISLVIKLDRSGGFRRQRTNDLTSFVETPF